MANGTRWPTPPFKGRDSFEEDFLRDIYARLEEIKVEETHVHNYYETGLETSFVDRGDPAGVDWAIGAFTTDNTWRDLDLSGIVPVGAKVVLLRVHLLSNAGGAQTWAKFRKNGNVNAANVAATDISDTLQCIHADLTVACDEDRVVEYCIGNIVWTTIEVTVGGWWV